MENVNKVLERQRQEAAKRRELEERALARLVRAFDAKTPFCDACVEELNGASVAPSRHLHHPDDIAWTVQHMVQAAGPALKRLYAERKTRGEGR